MWSVVCLTLLAVLAPTGCILYFMNEAINNQRASAHQKLADAYRVQLRMVQESPEGYWEKRAAALDRVAGASPAAIFAQSVSSGLADAIIYLGAGGKPLYPEPPAPPAADRAAARPEWLGAKELEAGGRLKEAAADYGQIAAHESDANLAGRALQAQIRCTAPGNRSAALALVDRFQEPRLAAARDLEGRLIGADELLFAIHLLPAGDRGRLELAQRLHHLAADYEGVSMPSGQRLFLMEELKQLALGSGTTEFPTRDAEQLAAQYMEAGRVHPADAALRLSDVEGIWRIGSASGRVVALYREATIDASLGNLLGEATKSMLERNVTIGISTPGSTGIHDLTLGGGPHMPGWQFTLDVKDSGESLGLAAKQRASYIWVAILVIATLSLTALLAGRAFLRQLRLAHLKTDLVATVSHELKTPLAGIQVLVDTLLDSPQDDPGRTREYLELIARENARLSRLIANFLTFSRMERNRAQFEFAATRPEAVVRAAIESVGDRFEVEVSCPAGLPALYADEDALVTVLLNLLDNAFKYSAEPRHIRLSAYAEAERCCFAVEDNGVGIAGREQKKIFRRFYQVNRRLTTHSGGVGLGLSIVQFIVKAHGGTVAVESKPGAGSRFVVSLPGASAVKGAAA